ncbi:MAG TPA: beta-L-arabinofuranosidase domain-containing protein [Blastocatellia bacterium]|nr:beta-L-arabinofuranosidase domain-containing protein [Blastocatellia bacterium]
MKLKQTCAALLLVILCAGVATPASQPQAGAVAPPRRSTKPPRDYPVKPVPFTAVHFNDLFWAPRIDINRRVTIPFAFQKCEETGRVANLEHAAAALRNEPNRDKTLPGYPFDDTDIYKVIEGAAYTLSVQRDPKLEAYIDGLVAKIAAAQEPDGYLYPARTINPEHPHKWAGTKRWEAERQNSHELYEIGHLTEAAVAYYQATGKRALLDVALKCADLLDRTFGPGKQSIWPGHQITEMALAKLYRETGDERFVKLAKFLLDARGPDGAPGGGNTYNQSHMKVTDQVEAVGHAVRATYMYSGMADVAALTGDDSYVRAIDRIWDNVVDKKLYITGGIGSVGQIEGFGADYDLPNMSAYNETCAAIGNDYWNYRLFLLHQDARYVDVMERTLYNGLLSGVSLDGKLFFYPNPLESNGQHQRSPWFGCACCPGNITRFLASVPGYVYAEQGDTLYVNLFVASTAAIKLDSGRSVRVTQATRYPWAGDIHMTVNPDRAGRFTINVRIPGWARNEAVPGDLYRFADKDSEPVTLKVNGQPVALDMDKGYAKLSRVWQRGDVIEMTLPMPVRRVVANDRVEADRNRVALQRGPLVYCAEWPDSPDHHVRNLLLPDDTGLKAEFRPDLLNGVVVIKGRSVALAYNEQGQVNKKEQDFLAIPYYAWANRGAGEMTVWVANRETSARPQPVPTVASTSTVRVSGGEGERAINDQAEPLASSDVTNSYFHWWPHKGTAEWAEYDFAKSATVSEADVYWYDDTGRGECRVPASWRVLYKDGERWKPVENLQPYGSDKDRYNRVTFKPVTTTALRLKSCCSRSGRLAFKNGR